MVRSGVRTKMFHVIGLKGYLPLTCGAERRLTPVLTNRRRGGPCRERRGFGMKALVVGDPGIEPGAGRPGGVTVRCRTLQLVAHT